MRTEELVDFAAKHAEGWEARLIEGRHLQLRRICCWVRHRNLRATGGRGATGETSYQGRVRIREF